MTYEQRNMASIKGEHQRAGTAVYLQDLCYRHRYIRSRDTSLIFERPERLRAIKVGLSAALSRLDELASSKSQQLTGVSGTISSSTPDENDLAATLARMNINPTDGLDFSKLNLTIVQSSATIDILNHSAVKFIHGDIEGDVYLENLISWVMNSQDKIAAGASEIPEGQGLLQSDLYLCPGSLDAIQGAIGTVCEAVDGILTSPRPPPLEPISTSAHVPGSRAFVAIRPPGHHCGEDTPSGFCFVNNVAIAAAHAHLQHGINRVVIFDIDLHHGNGTQSIAWQINEETYRLTLGTEHDSTTGPQKPGLQIYYGSMHDILSYPCEDGKSDVVQAASVSIHGPHGQHIENIHLEPYSSEEHFWDVLYKEQYCKLLNKARAFLEKSNVTDDALVLISCGFDACEHEYPAMSRHDRKVPTSFYYRFAKDAVAFANRYAQGRIISILEGGYSDRALISGAMAHLCGLADTGELGAEPDESWWSVQNLEKLELATKKRRGNHPRSAEPWIERTTEILSKMDVGPAQHITPSSSRNANVTPSVSMTLRERKKPASAEFSPAGSPADRSKARTKDSKAKSVPESATTPQRESHDDSTATSSSSSPESKSSENLTAAPRKLPRVILRLGPPPIKDS